MSGKFTIARCPVDRRAEALRALHDGLPNDLSLGLVQALELVQRQGEQVFDGLFAAFEADKVIGATWAQLTPGRTAVAWLPDATSPAALALMQSMAAFLDEQQITLAQFLALDDDAMPSELLQAADFQKLAKLAYLSADRDSYPRDQPNSELEFLAHASESPARLGELLIRTYEDTLDCPQLNGVRDSGDVLEGYREQGKFASDGWFFVQHQGVDVGALILATYPESGNWELVYMGLVPEQRGKGFGREILEFAMWQAATGSAERLVLAVDEQNRPALDTYNRAGFVAWDHRTVYARLRPGSD